MAEKMVIWKKIVSDGNGGDDEKNNPARWTDDDDDELERPRSTPVTIGDTAYAQFEEQRMQDAELAYEKMNPEQRAAGVNGYGDAPTNITPVKTIVVFACI
jgi:hypothetical protein